MTEFTSGKKNESRYTKLGKIAKMLEDEKDNPKDEKFIRLEEVPSPPDNLDAEGKNWWTYLGGELLLRDNLYTSWLPILENCCKLYDLRAAAEACIKETGHLYTNQLSGVVSKNPATTMLMDLNSKIQASLAELMLTPKSIRKPEEKTKPDRPLFPIPTARPN